MVDAKKIAGHADPASRRQNRGVLTRQNLLRSAKAIFARDGFEHTRIEDIACKAGKTRGAFYDNFKDKEDVFFAIFEDNLDRDMAELSPLLLSLPRIKQRIDALAEYLSELSKDRERILLNLEFKLYAIRHPRRRKRLADLHARMCMRTCIPELNQVLPHLGDGPHQQALHSLLIGGIVDGLALNHLFDPDKLGPSELAHYLKLCLREMLMPASVKLR